MLNGTVFSCARTYICLAFCFVLRFFSNKGIIMYYSFLFYEFICKLYYNWYNLFKFFTIILYVQTITQLVPKPRLCCIKLHSETIWWEKTNAWNRAHRTLPLQNKSDSLQDEVLRISLLSLYITVAFLFFQACSLQRSWPRTQKCFYSW